MGSFADEARAVDANAVVPKEWQAQSVWDGDTGTITTGPIAGAQLTDFREVLVQFGYDPARVEIVGKINQWRKERPDGTWLTSYFFGVQSKRDTVDLPALYATAKARPRARVKVAPVERATVVILADPQIGKTGRRGGTPELVDRMQEKREKLSALLKVRKPSLVGFGDAGDGFEGFESGGNPMFTNDLSLAQQMDSYGTELYLMLELVHKFAPVKAFGVPSNHTAWRNSKQTLGRPADDLGLFVQQQVLKLTTAAGMDVSWAFPADYDESVAVDILGTTIGLVHGNQFSPGGAVAWWEKQTFGAQAIARADVLVHGHYHSFSASVAGRNPVNDRQRWCFGAPTLDNGSDWYRTIAGRDSDPGLLVFDVTPEGFDIGSLTIL